MNTKHATGIFCVLVFASSCITDFAIRNASAANSWACPTTGTGTVVEVPANQQVDCVDYEASRARVLKDPGWFATGCAVPLTDNGHYDDCLPQSEKGTDFLKKDDRMRVDQYGDDDFRLTIWRPDSTKTSGEAIVSNVQLRPQKIKNSNYYGWLEGTDSGHLYFVYLSEQVTGTGPVQDKYYKVDVYSGAMCITHSPPVTQTPVKCDAKKSGNGSGQGNTGGGGEPPPR